MVYIILTWPKIKGQCNPLHPYIKWRMNAAHKKEHMNQLQLIFPLNLHNVTLTTQTFTKRFSIHIDNDNLGRNSKAKCGKPMVVQQIKSSCSTCRHHFYGTLSFYLRSSKNLKHQLNLINNIRYFVNPHVNMLFDNCLISCLYQPPHGIPYQQHLSWSITKLKIHTWIKSGDQSQQSCRFYFPSQLTVNKEFQNKC